MNRPAYRVHSASQDFNRKLLQIDNSATTVPAAPLANANATASVLAPSSSSNNAKPHSILEDVIGAYKAKFGKGSVPVPSTIAVNASAAATAAADDGDDYYTTPCTSDPIPTEYEAFVEVSSHFCILAYWAPYL